MAAAGFRVVTPWLKGYTPSSAPSHPAAYQAEALGADVIELLDALEAESAILVGHDWGATAVMAASILFPERVEKLVSVAIPHQAVSVDPLFLWRARHFITLATDDGEAILAFNDFAPVDTYFKRWSPLWQVPDAEVVAVENRYADAPSSTGPVNYYRALWLDRPPAPFMEDPIAVPTLALPG